MDVIIRRERVIVRMARAFLWNQNSTLDDLENGILPINVCETIAEFLNVNDIDRNINC